MDSRRSHRGSGCVLDTSGQQLASKKWTAGLAIVAGINMGAHTFDKSPGKLAAAAIARDGSWPTLVQDRSAFAGVSLGNYQVRRSQLYVLSHWSAAGLIVVL